MMPDRETAHAHLAERLALPDYYGKNLDALFDVLTGNIDVPTRLVIKRHETLIEVLGGYGVSILETIWDAVRENPCLSAECGEES